MTSPRDVETGDKLDLRRAKPDVQGPRPARDTGEKAKERQAAIIAAAAAPIEAPEADSKVAASKPLVARSMGIPITYTNPDTGQVTTIEIVSKVPDEAELDAIHAEIRRRLRNAAWNTMPEWMILRAMALATCWVQIKNAPDWFMARIGEDGALLFDTYGRLVEHNSTYFPGNEGEGAPGSPKPRLAVGPLTPLTSPVPIRST